jgi:4-hydroxyproline epimerase
MKHIFQCIDAHTCGNPVRLVKEGGPVLKGADMREKRIHFLEEFDWIRKGLMFEPRGHDMMSGSILYPPQDPANDVAVLFIETSGCLPMCGHGTIGTITIAIEKGLIKPKTPGFLKMEAPAGLIEIRYGGSEDKGTTRVDWVELTNVASFLHTEDLSVNCPGLGELNVDIAYGGNFYAIVDPQENFKGLEFYTAAELVGFARLLREAINKKIDVKHPLDSYINGCSHVMWTGSVLNPASTARNAVFYGDKAIDRSPCGTGTSARMAQWVAKGKLKMGDSFNHESIIGSTFEGQVAALTQVGEFEAIIPRIKGWARIYGYNTICIDTDDDPYAHGFQVI